MKCKICEKEYNSNLSFSLHIINGHKLKLKEYYDSYLKKENEGICLVCGKETNFRKINIGYSKYCSLKCSANSEKTKNIKKQTNMQRYGVENPSQNKEIREKIKQTNLNKYGVENPSQNKEIREKQKQTCIEHYGVLYPLQNDENLQKQKETMLKRYNCKNSMELDYIKDKIKQTNLERYDVEYVFQSKNVKNKIKKTNLEKYGKESYTQTNEYREKIKQTNLEKYGVEFASQSDLIKIKTNQTNVKRYGVNRFTQTNEYKEKRYNEWFYNFKKRLKEYNLLFLNKDDKDIELKCLKCNNSFKFCISNLYKYLENNITICPYCNPRWCGYSNEEKELVDYIKSIYDGEIIENDRNVLNGQELDIYLPKKKIAFEFNGLYWHSSEYKDKDYHLNKTIESEKQGIQLVHIFDNEWLNEKENIKKYINDLINYKIDIDNYLKVFSKEGKIIKVNRMQNNGLLLEKFGYKLNRILEPNLEKINVNNKIYEIYNCGYLEYIKE